MFHLLMAIDVWVGIYKAEGHIYHSQAWYNVSSPSCLKLRISLSCLAVLDGGQYLWIKDFLRRSKESTVPRENNELWKLQKHIHDLTWKLYDLCRVHHVCTEKGINIYMLVEKEYPLLRGTLTQMLVTKLLVEQDNEMSRELLRKIFMQVERLRR
ncbi:hypothetical protein Tco_0797943 [Tanacetum coccineum]